MINENGPTVEDNNHEALNQFHFLYTNDELTNSYNTNPYIKHKVLTLNNKKSHIKPLSRINAPKNRGAGASARIYSNPKPESLLTHGNIKRHDNIFNALHKINRDNTD
eukprot:242594_1